MRVSVSPPRVSVSPPSISLIDLEALPPYKKVKKMKQMHLALCIRFQTLLGFIILIESPNTAKFYTTTSQ